MCERAGRDADAAASQYACRTEAGDYLGGAVAAEIRLADLADAPKFHGDTLTFCLSEWTPATDVSARGVSLAALVPPSSSPPIVSRVRFLSHPACSVTMPISKEAHDELCVTYAALALYDGEAAITGDQLMALIKETGNEVEPCVALP